MDIDYDNDEGIGLLAQIVLEEISIKNNYEIPTREQEEDALTLVNNIIAAALEEVHNITYMTDSAVKNSPVDPLRQKEVYDATSKAEAEKITLMRDYFATGNLKALEDYLDNLFNE